MNYRQKNIRLKTNLKKKCLLTVLATNRRRQPASTVEHSTNPSSESLAFHLLPEDSR